MSETRLTAPPETQIVELVAPAGDLVARFAANAGMVGCSLRHRGEELLGLGEGLDAYLATGKVFGIPLLHPWANRLGGWEYTAGGRTVVLDRGSPLLHGDEHCLPIHGTVASVGEWTLTGRGDEDEGAWLAAELDLGAHRELLALFPFPHRIELAVRLADGSLRVTTTVRAGEAPVPLTYGFHPYLSPPGVPREAWLVELPARAEMALDDHSLPTGERAPRDAERFTLGERTYDDLFALPGAPARFAVSGGGRRLQVEFGDGFPYAQVFAPPDDPVICFEPMTAPIDALRSGDGLRLVAPGETARATWALTVHDTAP
jgi:galactose mutarotase-like enzyme